MRLRVEEGLCGEDGGYAKTDAEGNGVGTEMGEKDAGGHVFDDVEEWMDGGREVIYV